MSDRTHWCMSDYWQYMVFMVLMSGYVHREFNTFVWVFFLLILGAGQCVVHEAHERYSRHHTDLAKNVANRNVRPHR